MRQQNFLPSVRQRSYRTGLFLSAQMISSYNKQTLYVALKGVAMGATVETFAVSELLKYRMNQGKKAPMPLMQSCRVIQKKICSC